MPGRAAYAAPGSSSSLAARRRFGFSGVGGGLAQAALQVVEDEPDGRVGAVVAAIARPPSSDDEDAAVERRRLDLGHVAALASETAAAASSSSPAPRRRAPPRRAVVGGRRADRPRRSSSKRTAASICDEISVRSASAWAASIGAEATSAPADGCGRLRAIPQADARAEVLRRPRHPPRRDGRLLRAALVRAAALPRALAARARAPRRRVGLLRQGALARRSRAPRSTSILTPCARSRTTRPRSGSSAASCCSGRRSSLFSVLETAFNIVYDRPNRAFLRGKALAVDDDGRLARDLFASLVVGALGVEVLRRTPPRWSSNAASRTSLSVAVSLARRLRLPARRPTTC